MLRAGVPGLPVGTLSGPDQPPVGQGVRELPPLQLKQLTFKASARRFAGQPLAELTPENQANRHQSRLAPGSRSSPVCLPLRSPQRLPRPPWLVLFAM